MPTENVEPVVIIVDQGETGSSLCSCQATTSRDLPKLALSEEPLNYCTSPPFIIHTHQRPSILRLSAVHIHKPQLPSYADASTHLSAHSRDPLARQTLAPLLLTPILQPDIFTATLLRPDKSPLTPPSINLYCSSSATSSVIASNNGRP